MDTNDIKLWASSGCGRIEMQITYGDAKLGSHSGDCEDDVRGLMTIPYIKHQLDRIDVEVLRNHMEEYGAWEDHEIDDHDDNLMRMLWLFCGDIAQGYTECTANAIYLPAIVNTDYSGLDKEDISLLNNWLANNGSSFADPIIVPDSEGFTTCEVSGLKGNCVSLLIPM